MRFFFYGTLIDPEVLHTVIRRSLAPGDRRSAVLRGFRRVFRRGAGYPVLVPDRACEVEGVVVAGLDRRDAALLSAFEGAEYRAALLPVRLKTDRVIHARVFLPAPGCPTTAEEWTLEEWRSRFRRDFLRRIRGSRKAAGPAVPHPSVSGPTGR